MITIVLLFFIAILLGVAAIFMGYASVKAAPAYELKRRLRKLALESDERLPSELQVEILKEMTPVDRFLYKFSLIRRLDKLADSAGLKIDIKLGIIFLIIAPLVGFTLGISLRRGVGLAVLFAIIAFIAPLLYLQVKKNQRIMKFTEEFPGALDMMARSLRAGHSISSAIQMVGEELADPVAGLFKTAYEEQTLGLSMRDALSRMYERIPSIDLRLFLTAVNIHREVGGNLSETLERLAHTIRERIKIRRQIRVYTAQGRLTGIILAALPILMAIFLYVVDPDYLSELVDIKEGRYAIAVVVAAQIIGILVIRKMINIRI
jgi:tight adherence protein B